MRWANLSSFAENIPFFGRFAKKNSFFGCANDQEIKRYERFTAKDRGTGMHLAEPLLVADDNDEVNLYGVEGFSRNFVDIASLIANPGQGKSRLATTMYNLMRKTDNKYFMTSDGAVSFTKGVWRLSNEQKQKGLSMDMMDILDVEGLQKENAVYYLLICVVVLSKSIVLLSRERVNKEALGVLEIAFKILDSLGIALKKPVLFIQTKFDEAGNPIGDDGGSTTIAHLLDSIQQEAPVVKDFQVEFFSLTEIPAMDVLKQICYSEDMANEMLDHATSIYEQDVEALLDRLISINDPLSSEQRMHYLISVLDHLNSKNPDLVLEQNLDFFTKDAERWLNVEVCREREHLVQLHLNKPLGSARTLQEFFEAPPETLKSRFLQYCEQESPFVGKEKDYEIYIAAAEKVFNSSHYANAILKITDSSSGEVIGIMSYGQASFEAKMKTDETVLEDIYNVLIQTVENSSSFDLFCDELPESIDHIYSAHVFTKYSHIDGLAEIVQGRWEQVRVDMRNRKNSLLFQSMWMKKVMCEGDLRCPSCLQEHIGESVQHIGCPNDRSVPVIMWYWIKDSYPHKICNGCKEICSFRSVCCSACFTTLPGPIVDANW